MKVKSLLLVMAALPPLCARAQSASIEDRTLSYRCGDTVIVGRIKNGGYAPVQDDEDIVGHGWIDAHIRVKRHLKGAKVPTSLPIRYYVHTHIRDDRDFMFVLSGNGTDGFMIKYAQLMSVRPIIPAECEH